MINYNSPNQQTQLGGVKFQLDLLSHLLGGERYDVPI